MSTTISGGLLNVGLALTVIPGFLEEVDSEPPSEGQPLAERIVDSLVGFAFGALSMSSAPVLIAAAGAAAVGEKACTVLDGLFTMAHQVEESGKSIETQAEIIKSFGPLLEISKDTLKELAGIAQEKGVEWKSSTLRLKDLEENYLANADLLEIVNERITFLQAVLPPLISQKKITLTGQGLITSNIDLVHQIAVIERETQELVRELTERTHTISNKVAKLKDAEGKTAALTEVKGALITDLQGDIESLIAQQELITKTSSKAVHGNAMVSVL
jgi:hypothetical protein